MNQAETIWNEYRAAMAGIRRDVSRGPVSEESASRWAAIAKDVALRALKREG